MARWLPSAIGPFMDVDAIFYAGALNMNGLEPEYVLAFYFHIYALITTIYLGPMRKQTIYGFLTSLFSFAQS